MILSRSRRHGLEPGQVHLAFDIQQDHVAITGRLLGEPIAPLNCTTTTPSDEVLALIRRLEACPVDGRHLPE